MHSWIGCSSSSRLRKLENRHSALRKSQGFEESIGQIRAFHESLALSLHRESVLELVVEYLQFDQEGTAPCGSAGGRNEQVSRELGGRRV